MKRTGLIVAALLLALLALIGMKSAFVPIPGPATAGSAGFDTARARAGLERLLGDQRPHPVDS